MNAPPEKEIPAPASNGNRSENTGSIPHDPDSEQEFLECLLFSPSEGLATLQKSHPQAKEYFYDFRHGAIYEAIQRLEQEGTPVHAISIHAEIENAIIDRAYIAALCSKAFTGELLNYHANHLASLWRRRILRELHTRAAHAALSGEEEILERAHARIVQLSKPAAPKKRLSFRSPGDIVSMEFTESDKIIGDRLFAKGQSLVILGEAGIGKSTLVIFLAACCVTGRDFFTLETFNSNLKWLFIQTENSTRRLQKDFERLRAWLGEEDWIRFCERVRFHTLEHDEDGFLSVDDPEAMVGIDSEIQEFQPGVVVFDPLNEFGSGDLNTDEAMKRTLRVLSRVVKRGDPDRSIVVLHHSLTGKAGASKATGYDRTSFGRNSKALVAWARGQINIAPGSGDPGDGLLVIACGKCSNGKPFPRFAARLDQDRMVYELCASFDWAGWEASLAPNAKEKVKDSKQVADLCGMPISQADLAKKISLEWGVKLTNSYRPIKNALISGTIKLDKSGANYVRA